jgi:hypothetical protein
LLKSNAYQVIYIDLPEFEKQARGIIKTGADAIQGGGIIVGGKTVEDFLLKQAGAFIYVFLFRSILSEVSHLAPQQYSILSLLSMIMPCHNYQTQILNSGNHKLSGAWCQ